MASLCPPTCDPQAKGCLVPRSGEGLGASRNTAWSPCLTSDAFFCSIQQRIGYLAASQCFHEGTDVIMLTTNQIRKVGCPSHRPMVFSALWLGSFGSLHECLFSNTGFSVTSVRLESTKVSEISLSQFSYRAESSALGHAIPKITPTHGRADLPFCLGKRERWKLAGLPLVFISWRWRAPFTVTLLSRPDPLAGVPAEVACPSQYAGFPLVILCLYFSCV